MGHHTENGYIDRINSNIARMRVMQNSEVFIVIPSSIQDGNPQGRLKYSIRHSGFKGLT